MTLTTKVIGRCPAPFRTKYLLRVMGRTLERQTLGEYDLRRPCHTCPAAVKPCCPVCNLKMGFEEMHFAHNFCARRTVVLMPHTLSYSRPHAALIAFTLY